MSKRTSDVTVWYLKRDKRLAGPYSSAAIRRLLLQGQVSLDDQVSADRKRWSPVSQVPEVVPPGLRGGAPGQSATLSGAGRVPWLPIGVFLAILAVALAIAVRSGGSFDAGKLDCGSPPAPAVDWRGCALGDARLAGADLRGARLDNADLASAALAGADLRGANLDYANLSGADLAYSQLSTASLRGANLRGADLSSADLKKADLRFADLTAARLDGAELSGARLGEAIWLDRRVCARGSMGECR